jgi:plastocyanin
MLRFCSTVWGHARNMKSLIMASVAVGAVAAPIVLAVSGPNSVAVTVFDFGFNPTNIRVKVGGSVTWNYSSGASEHEIAALMALLPAAFSCPVKCIQHPRSRWLVTTYTTARFIHS